MAFQFERIDEINTRVSGYTLPIKDLLKRHKGSFESTSRTWLVPNTETARLRSDIMVYENQQKRVRELKWTKALEQCGHKFAAKGSTAYDEVLAVYKCL